MSFRFLLSLLLLCQPMLMNAQGTQGIRVFPERDSIMIGDQIGLVYEFPRTDTLSYTPLTSKNMISEGIEIISLKVDTLEKSFRWNYTISSYEAGVLLIPGLPILAGSSESTDTLIIPGFQLMVYEPEVDTSAAFKDIKPLMNTPLNFAEMKPWILKGLLIVALIAGLGIVVWLWMNRKKIASVFKPPLAPHLKAIDELEAMKREKAWTKLEVKQYYTLLTDILRHYLHDRFGIFTMERTSSEILIQFSRIPGIEEDARELLSNILTTADEVKFAKGQPSTSVNELKLNLAIILVRKTRPPETEEKTEIDPQRETGEVPTNGMIEK